jgi:broad specificity phosphatase PhoE
MNTFFIVRHGETENNKTGRISGWIDSPLTEKGKSGIQKVADKLSSSKIDAIYSSDLGRAFITAYTIARARNFADEIRRDWRLRDVCYGDFAYGFFGEKESEYPGLNRDINYTPPNGESLLEMQKRVLEAVGEINMAHVDENILIVAHDGVVKAIRQADTREDFGKLNFEVGISHESVFSFTMQDDSVTAFAELLT